MYPSHPGTTKSACHSRCLPKQCIHGVNPMMQRDHLFYKRRKHSYPTGFSTRIRWDMNASAACKINDPAASSDLRRGCTVSEGIGYGMLISLFPGDWDTFNRR